MGKIIKNSKMISIIQYISIIILTFSILVMNVQSIFELFKIYDREDFGAFILATFGAGVILLIIIIGYLGISALVMLILSTTALILNLRKSDLKNLKAARILNLICIVANGIYIPFYEMSIVNISLILIVIFNIYIMFIRKSKELEVVTESEKMNEEIEKM